MNNALAICLVLLWVGIATYGDTLFKGAPALSSGKFACAMLAYLATSFLAFWTFKLQQWGWIVLLWNSLSLGVSLFLSVAMFGEPFTIRRRVAAVLVLAAMLLTE
jgi:drug/metabolite transporter (DMT)-like permease